MKAFKLSLFIISFFLVFGNVKLLSGEITDSVNAELKKISRLTVLSSADIVGINTYKQNIYASLGFIREYIVLPNKYIPISIIAEGQISSPILFDKFKPPPTYFTLNAGLLVNTRISENWLSGVSLSSGMILVDDNSGVNTVSRISFTYYNFSIIWTLQSIVSEKFSSTNIGLGLAYTF